VHVLRHTHAPQDHGSLGLGEVAGGGAQGGGIDTADAFHRLGAVALEVFLQGVKAAGARVDELLIGQTFFHDGVHHGVQHGDVGARLEVQVVGGVTGDVGATRVGQDDLGAVLGGVLHPGRADRVVHGRVGADDHDHFGLDYILHRVRHSAGTDAFQQCDHGRCVAQAGAVVDVVAAETGTHQLLE